MNRGLRENTKKGFEKTESLFASLHRSMISGEDAVLNAVVPLLKLLSITLFGSILAHPKVQIIPKATFKILSKLVFVLFLPCLIFNYLGPSITLENFVLWWFIPVNVVISTFIGIILGYFVTLICRPPPEFFRFTIIMTAFGNTGNVPLAIVSSICHNTTDNPFGTDCYSSGVAYVAFSQWVSVILVYTFVYHMMEPPLEYYDIVEEENSEIEIQEEPIDCLSRPLLVEAEWPGLDDKEPEHYKIPIIARLFNSISGLSHTTIPHFDSIEEGSGDPKSPKSLRCLAEPRMVRKMRIVAEHTPIRHILQPPVLASLLAILIGIIPGLKSITFGRDVPLAFITDSLEMMSEAAVPSVMLIIGGMLTEGPNESRLGNRTTIGIIVARLVVLPFIGIGVICLAEKWNFLVTGDQLYRFVIFLQYTTPSAILLGAMASLRGYAVSEASALLFWQHVFALFSLTLSIIIYFKLLYVYA